MMPRVLNDNLCTNTAVPPKTPTYSYPQYNPELVLPPLPIKRVNKLPAHLRDFNKRFLARHMSRDTYCCQPHLPPRYRPVLPVPPAQFWTPVDLCNEWHYFDRLACCDKPVPYNWENDSCPTPYCRPGGVATPPAVLPFPNLGLYFPPCDVWRVKC